MSQERMLAQSNKDVQKEYQRNWEKVKELVQAVIGQYKTMGLPALKDIADVDRLINDTEGFVFDMQTGGGAIIRGTHGEHMPVNVGVAKTLFVKPDGYSQLTEVIAVFRDKSTEGIGYVGSVTRINAFLREVKKDFVYVNSELDFSEKRQLNIDEAGNAYVTTEKGKAIACFLKTLSKSFAENYEKMGFADRKGQVVKFDDMVNLFSRNFHGVDTATGEVRLILSNSINPGFPGDRE